MRKRRDSIVIFGAGAGARRARACLRHRYRIVAFADNDTKKHGACFLSRPIVAPSALSRFPTERIHIASMHADQIYRQLTVDLGINPARVEIVPRAILEGAYDVSPWTYAVLGLIAMLILVGLGGLGYVLVTAASAH